MNIIHILESTSPSGGGLPAAVIMLAENQVIQGHNVKLLTLRKDLNCISSSAYPLDILCVDHADFKSLQKIENLYIHLHGVWNLKLWILALKLRRNFNFLILSPHGQLMPSLINSDPIIKRAKKLTYKYIFLDRFVKSVDVVHAVCDAERDCIANYMPKIKCFPIPNYIDSKLALCSNAYLPKFLWEREIIFLFIGRIDERKGILDLVEAFVKAKTTRQIGLRIIGPVEDQSIIQKIYAIKEKNPSANNIEIKGPLYGSDKLDAYNHCAVVCLPSYSEVIGLVNIEASILKRCVVTTDRANIPIIGERGGYVIKPGTTSLLDVIHEISNLSYNDYIERCKCLYHWATNEFDSEKIKKRWDLLYSSPIKSRRPIALKR